MMLETNTCSSLLPHSRYETDQVGIKKDLFLSFSIMYPTLSLSYSLTHIISLILFLSLSLSLYATLPFQLTLSPKSKHERLSRFLLIYENKGSRAQSELRMGAPICTLFR